jgi:hypothetical protein
MVVHIRINLGVLIVVAMISVPVALGIDADCQRNQPELERYHGREDGSNDRFPAWRVLDQAESGCRDESA